MNLQQVAPQAARRELAMRNLAKRRFLAFEEYVAPHFRAARHHRLVAEKLEAVERYVATDGAEGIGRLLILEPPRHGKSEQVSRHFPAWFLGRNPDKRVIITSYGADLAVKFSRAARDIVMGTQFRAVFGSLAGTPHPASPTPHPASPQNPSRILGGGEWAPVAIAEDSRSVESWDLEAPHRGGVVAAGVGGAITGTGAHLFVIDDPFKNREEAESEARRESVWEWWTSTAYTRLEKGAAVVASLTRWHVDDWAGRILKMMVLEEGADQWEVVCLPAICEPVDVPEGETFEGLWRKMMAEGAYVNVSDPMGRAPGEALWPEKYDEAALAGIQVNVGAYDFAALYQQWPYLRSGALFQREDFLIVDVGPAAEKIRARVRMWDKAGTRTGQGGDYTVGVLMSMTVDDVVFVEHVIRRQTTPLRREELILTTAKADAKLQPRPATWHQRDPATAGLESAQRTNQMLAKAGLTGHFEAVQGDKILRAGPWSTAVEGGQVRLVRGGWNQAFIEEHVSFPRGKFDDQVDVSSTAFVKVAGKGRRREARSYQG